MSQAHPFHRVDAVLRDENEVHGLGNEAKFRSQGVRICCQLSAQATSHCLRMLRIGTKHCDPLLSQPASHLDPYPWRIKMAIIVHTKQAVPTSVDNHYVTFSRWFDALIVEHLLDISESNNIGVRTICWPRTRIFGTSECLTTSSKTARVKNGLTFSTPSFSSSPLSFGPSSLCEKQL